MSWTKVTDFLPKVDKLILLSYKQNVFVMRLKCLENLTVHGKALKHYYLDSALHGGWATNDDPKRLAIHPEMEWMYPSEFIVEQDQIESNVFNVTVD